MKYTTIQVEKDKGIAIIRLNRPEVRNAINEQMSQDFTNAIKDAAGDEESRAVVLTGTGNAFCAGADLWFGKVRDGEQTIQMA